MTDEMRSTAPRLPPASIGVGVVVTRRIENAPEVLLIRRGKPPGEGMWSIPGGRQEPGETTRETATREILEETGLALTDLRLIDVVDLIERREDGNIASQWILIDFCAPWMGGDIKAGSDAADARWVAFDDLRRYGLWAETMRVIMAGATILDDIENGAEIS